MKLVKMLWSLLTLLYCVSTASSRAQESTLTELVDRIVESIFTNYNKHQRPFEPAKDWDSVEPAEPPTRVLVNMKILSINKVDVINMEFTLDMYLRQYWKDHRLSWNSGQFKFYNESIAISAKKDHLWLPDLFFRNGKEGYLHKMTQPNYLIRVDPDGSILYSQKLTMKFSCQMQLQTFPMDTQTCFINIGSYGYTTRNLLFLWKRDADSREAVELDKTMQISEFNTPTSVVLIDCTQGSATSTGSYACLKAIFKLKRQLGSYLSGTYIPAILIVAVSWLNFWVSIDAIAARVTLGLLTLLGILTQAATVMESLPRVAYIKAIDIWIIASIMFVIGALIEFAVASFHARRTKMENWQQEIRNVVRQELQFIRGPPPPELEDLLAVSVKNGGGGGGAGGNAKVTPPPPVPSQDSKIDTYSRFVFPACFLLYNVFYWLYYLVLVVKIDTQSG